MQKSKWSVAKIISILSENEAGLGASELCRKHGMSDATFYNWRKKYGGISAADARRLKELELENSRLKYVKDSLLFNGLLYGKLTGADQRLY